MQVNVPSGHMPAPYCQSLLKSASRNNKLSCLLHSQRKAYRASRELPIPSPLLPDLLASFDAFGFYPRRLPSCHSMAFANGAAFQGSSCPPAKASFCGPTGDRSPRSSLPPLNNTRHRAFPESGALGRIRFLHSSDNHSSDNSKKPSVPSQYIHKSWLRDSSGFSLFKKGFAFHFYNFSTSLPQVGDLYVRALHDAKFTEAFPPENSEVLSDSSDEKREEHPLEKETSTSVSSLRLNSGACSFPHPAKADRGGEDAYFISPESNAVGVADGVGGWADMGVDAGLYARELMMRSSDALVEEPKGDINPARVLCAAHSKTKSQGSSTACILVLKDDKLQAANLGDSGFIVIRNGRIIFKSPSQQHDFNFPFQVGSEGCDPPESAEVFLLPVAAGDVLVAGTDGLFDNVFDNELTSVVMHSIKAGSSPQGTAEKIAALARIRAQDRARVSPFSKAAQEAGWLFIGGKLDDITVVVSYISPGG